MWRNRQFDHATFADVLQAFGPARNDLVDDERGTHPHLVAAIENRPVVQGALVMDPHHALGSGAHGGTQPKNLILQSRGRFRKVLGSIGVDDVAAWREILPAGGY